MGSAGGSCPSSASSSSTSSSTTCSGREPLPPRGHYRILLGMAAGVGKTYRMLLEGRQAQEEGKDVVIGYLEPHDRPETSVLAEGLEVVPRLRRQQGLLELEEMDVDGVIRRGPE